MGWCYWLSSISPSTTSGERNTEATAAVIKKPKQAEIFQNFMVQEFFNCGPVIAEYGNILKLLKQNIVDGSGCCMTLLC